MANERKERKKVKRINTTHRKKAPSTKKPDKVMRTSELDGTARVPREAVKRMKAGEIVEVMLAKGLPGHVGELD